MLGLRIPDSQVVKSNVKAVLKNRRIAAGIVGIFPYLIYLVLVSLYGVFAMLLIGRRLTAVSVAVVIGLFLLLPVVLGAIRWFWRVADGCEDAVTDVFYYFTSLFLYKRALKCIFLFMFKCLMAMLISLLPYFVITLLSNSWIYQFVGTEIPLWVAGLALVQAFLRIVGIIAGLVAISRYYLFPVLVVTDDNMLLLEALHISILVSKRSAVYFLALVISLVGYMLLSLFMVPIFYTAPIFFTAYVVHARFAIVNHNQNLDRLKKEQYTL